MTALPIKKYNEQQTAKWKADYNKKMAEKPNFNYGTACLPQLAFYIFNKTYGYVAFGVGGHYWAKTKKEAIELYENRKIYK